MEQKKDFGNRSIQHVQLIFDKDAKVNQWRKIIFSTNGIGTIGCHMEENEPQPLSQMLNKQ